MGSLSCECDIEVITCNQGKQVQVRFRPGWIRTRFWMPGNQVGMPNSGQQCCAVRANRCWRNSWRRKALAKSSNNCLRSLKGSNQLSSGRLQGSAEYREGRSFVNVGTPNTKLGKSSEFGAHPGLMKILQFERVLQFEGEEFLSI